MTVTFRHSATAVAVGTATAPFDYSTWSKPPAGWQHLAPVRLLAGRLAPFGQSGSGVFGGTFDPPHVGHLVTAVNVRHALGLDRVLLDGANGPGRRSAHAPSPPPRTGWRWSRRRSPASPGSRPAGSRSTGAGPSYTADTLGELGAAHPGAELFLDRRRRRRRRPADLGARRRGARACTRGRGRPPGRRRVSSTARVAVGACGGAPPRGVEHRPAGTRRRRPAARLPSAT